MNFVPDSKSGKCTECPAHSFAYPGTQECIARPECKIEYDFAQINGECNEKGKRSVKYELKKESVCNKANFDLKSLPTEIDCQVCNPGSYVEKGVCKLCKDGEYSSAENSKKCEVCPSGKFTPKAEIFANFEKLPSIFETNCEKVQGVIGDLCLLHKGWIVANNALTVMPNTPIGVKLNLKTKIDIKEENKGKLIIKYKGAEAITLIIDSEVTRKRVIHIKFL